MNDLYLIPNAGLIVRDPLTGKPLPEGGASKPRSSYWLRRLRDGDVRQGKPSASTAKRLAVVANNPTKGEAK